MTSERRQDSGAYDDLRLDGNAGPARPVSGARQARMIDAAFLAELRSAAAASQDATPTLPSGNGRSALAEFMIRYAAVAVAVLLAGGSVAGASLAIATALQTHGPEKPSALPTLSPPRSVIRARHLPPPSDIPAAPEAPPPIEPTGTQGHHQNQPRVAPDLLASANALRAQGKWREAARTYRQAARAAPRSGPAYVATFAIATLEAEHFGSPERALRLFNELLLLRPQGILAEEVHLGIAQCYRRLGARNAERSALQDLVNRYPNSLAVPRVRARLSQLQALQSN